MKFTGLILICAASSLALILPATGVVRFPMQTGAVVALIGQGNAPSSTLPPGLPVAVAAPANGLPPLGGAVPSSPQENADGAASSGSAWTKQKVGMGVWLLLGPTVLIGLALWTFAPNRRGVGR